MAGLTPKQQAFVNAYLIEPNATVAYRKACPNVKSDEVAGAAGRRLLRNVTVRAAIEAARERVAERVEIEAVRVVEEVAAVAFSDIGDILDFSGEQPRLRPAHQISEKARRAISGIKVKRSLEKTADGFREVEVIEFKLWDKNSAADKLARIKGMYKDTMEVKGQAVVQIDWDALAARRAAPDPIEERIRAEGPQRNGHHPQ